MRQDKCELCERDGGSLVIANEFLRVVLVDEPRYPGFARVVWNDHVRELSDLDEAARRRLMETVFAVESALREVMSPLKVNVASLGNMTPHVHWHVIPRFADDSHFPQSVWGSVQRTTPETTLSARRAQLAQLKARIAECVARVPS